MATVYFAPNAAVRYVGKKHKELATSLARPKPILKQGDIVVLDKRSAFNMTTKGFGDFVAVESISFTKKDKLTEEELKALQEEISQLREEVLVLQEERKSLQDKNMELAQKLFNANENLDTKE